MKKLKVGDKVKFQFAGQPEQGVIVSIDSVFTTVYDGNYRYPVKKEILTKIK